MLLALDVFKGGLKSFRADRETKAAMKEAKDVGQAA